MRSPEHIKRAIAILECQAALLERDGAGDGLASNCCYATLSMLHWVLDDGTHPCVGVAAQLDEWAQRQGQEKGKFQRPALN
jgi:hypothetical protein